MQAALVRLKEEDIDHLSPLLHEYIKFVGFYLEPDLTDNNLRVLSPSKYVPLMIN